MPPEKDPPKISQMTEEQKKKLKQQVKEQNTLTITLKSNEIEFLNSLGNGDKKIGLKILLKSAMFLHNTFKK